MKRTIILLLVTFVAFSCSETFLDEDPKGNLVSDGFFKNSSDLNLAINALYKGLANTGYQNHYLCMYFGSDDLTTRSGSNKENFRDFDMFVADKDQNSRITEIWGDFYGLVSCANFIILGYQDATLATEQERTYAAGQAHFMRAYAYFNIVKIWNSAPLVTTNLQDKDIMKSPPEDIYELIISDLQNAETMLPVSWSSDPLAEKGVTIGAAKSLLAQVYLQMTGYPIKDASKYALAAQKAKEVIDNADEYGYKILDNYADLWLDVPLNDELVFGCFYNNQAGDASYRAAYSSQPTEEGGWADLFCEINFFKEFPAGPRKDATFQTKIVLAEGDHDTLDWTEGVRQHPYFKKMRYANGTGPGNYVPWQHISYSSSRTNQIIRFAEVKLIYAEAHAMSASPDASAYKEVNDIRNRAGLPDLTPGLDQVAFRDSVVMERKWEFAGDEFGQRWNDLVRLEMVEQANANRDPLELPLSRTPSKDDYFAPIPVEERLINPNLDL